MALPPRWDHRLPIALVAALGLLVAGGGGVLGWRLVHPGPDVSGAPVPLSAALDPPAPAELLVYVSGAVSRPGLYRLAAGARVADAVAAAGGVTADADVGRMPDLAARLHDGKQVNVPFRRSGGAGGSSTLADRVDVNEAGIDELRTVPGMPVGLPEAIVQARELFGAFGTLAEVRTVLGLDAATWSAVRAHLRAGTATR